MSWVITHLRHIISNLRRQHRESRRRWESLCNNCGACCYEKKIVRGRVVIDYSAPCPHLNISDKKCSVYPDRFKVCRECEPMTLRHAMFTGYLPESCGYVQKYRVRINLLRRHQSP